MTAHPLHFPDARPSQALLDYRAGLGSLGLMTVDSIRVTPTRFEANLHEYGIEANQHGLPLMHATLKLDFELLKDGSVLISRVFFDIEFIRLQRRSSVFAMPAEEVVLSGEL